MHLTRRQFAQAYNLGAPLDAPLREVPKKRAKATGEREWRLQAAAVKATRERMRYDKNLWYEVNLIEGARDPHRRAMAAMMGMQRGPNDFTLYRRFPANSTSGPSLLTVRIEFKLPGGCLTPEQEAWFAFHRSAGVRCELMDNLADFLRVLDGV